MSKETYTYKIDIYITDFGNNLEYHFNTNSISPLCNVILEYIKEQQEKELKIKQKQKIKQKKNDK